MFRALHSVHGELQVHRLFYEEYAKQIIELHASATHDAARLQHDSSSQSIHQKRSSSPMRVHILHCSAL